MIKNTMQEIANFFNSYVTKDKNETDICVSKYRPIKMKTKWFKHIFIEDIIYIDKQFVSDYDMHNWNILVKPQKNCNECTTNY